MLESAHSAVDTGNLAVGYASLLAAHREVIWDYSPQEITAAKIALKEEAADDKIGGWRARAINELVAAIDSGNPTLLLQLAKLSADQAVLDRLEDILRATNGDARAELSRYLLEAGNDEQSAASMAELLVKACAGGPSVARAIAPIAALGVDLAGDRVLLHQAMRIRDESFQNRYRRIERLQRQLLILSSALTVILVGILILAVKRPISLGRAQVSSGLMLAYVALFGALGGSLSAIQSLSRDATSLRIPEQMAMGAVTFVRPLFGVAAAVAIYAFLQSGLITVQGNSNAGVLAAAFAAGFTERLVVHAAALVSRARAGT